MPPTNPDLYAALLASYDGTVTSAYFQQGVLRLNHASAAGMLLMLFGRDPIKALAACPVHPWWDQTREYLLQYAEDATHAA
jgi:hypothetical protein